jgi:acid phosphatase type 7
MRLVADIFERRHVDIVFAGHDHTYQRSRPLTFHAIPDSTGHLRRRDGTVQGDFGLDSAFDGRTRTAPRGVLYIVSGAGGATLYDSVQTGDPSTWQPFTVKFVADVHSFTVVDIRDASLVLRQISEAGAELDRIRVTRRPAGPPR